MEEWGIQADLLIKSDAVAAIGMVKRQGLGRIRHLAVADLWIQQKSKTGDVHYKKLEGCKNVSDILTKPVEAEVLDRHMGNMGLEFRSGQLFQFFVPTAILCNPFSNLNPPSPEVICPS